MLKEIREGLSETPVVDGLGMEEWSSSWYGDVQVRYVSFSAQRGEAAYTSIAVFKLEPTGLCGEKLVPVPVSSCLVEHPFTLH